MLGAQGLPVHPYCGMASMVREKHSTWYVVWYVGGMVRWYGVGDILYC